MLESWVEMIYGSMYLSNGDLLNLIGVELITLIANFPIGRVFDPWSPDLSDPQTVKDPRK